MEVKSLVYVAAMHLDKIWRTWRREEMVSYICVQVTVSFIKIPKTMRKHWETFYIRFHKNDDRYLNNMKWIINIILILINVKFSLTMA